MKSTITFVLVIVLRTAVSYGQAQEQAVIADLKAQLKIEKIDTSRIFLLGDLARYLINSADTLSALNALKEGLVLSKKQNFTYGFGHIYTGFGSYYEALSDYKQAEKYYQLAYEYFKKSDYVNAPLGVASVLGNLGLIAERKGNIEKAIQLKIEGLKIWEASNVPQKALAIGNTYIGIASLYARQGQYQKAIDAEKKGIAVRLQYNYRDSDLGTSYVYLAADFIKNKQLDSAKKYLEIVEELAQELKNPVLDLRKDDIWSRLYFEEKNYPKSLEIGLKLHKRASEAKRIMIEMNADFIIGKSFQQLKQPQKAISFFEAALGIALRLKNIESQQKHLLELSETHRQLGNYKKAFEYLGTYHVLKDSINTNELTLKLNDIDTKYQTVQKEKQILVLEKEKQSQNVLIYSLLAGLIAGLIMSTLVYQNATKQKQIVQQKVILREKEILQLIQEQQLTASSAIMKGQEEERTRVARDLHDGLGGILTSIKLTLNKVGGNFILPEEGVAIFTRALAQLDLAIGEMRRVAHSMMPEALVRYGLTDALNDFCEGLNQSSTLKVRFQALGMEQRLDASTEIVLYRIVQELLNNVVKHAQATEVYVQLIRKSDVLSLTIEDNGIGFDTTYQTHQKGAGMRNITNRVAYLNGKIDIQSKPNEGTSVFIEIPTV